MPSITSSPGARILEGFVLQSISPEPDQSTVFNQATTVCGYEVRHSMAPPNVTMEPETSIHRVDHSVSAVRKLLEPTTALKPRTNLVIAHGPYDNALLADEQTLSGGRC
jgi:hypothetical protein